MYSPQLCLIGVKLISGIYCVLRNDGEADILIIDFMKDFNNRELICHEKSTIQYL